jgi:hypothetical protein
MLAHNLGILDRRFFFGTGDNYPGQTVKTDPMVQLDLTWRRLKGDKVDDLGSVYHGRRMRNIWKNSELLWTYDLNQELWLTEHQFKRFLCSPSIIKNLDTE